jgi:hypothetical protein
MMPKAAGKKKTAKKKATKAKRKKPVGLPG